MQGMVSGVLLVAAFAAVAGASGLVAVRLYWLSGAAGRSGATRRTAGAQDPPDA